MSEKTNLKPCPFCGLTDKDTISPDMGKTPAVSLNNYPGGFRVECEGCGCNGPWYHTYEPAIEVWNNSTATRADVWRDMAERLADKLGDFWLEHCPNAGRRKRDRDKCKCDICEAIQAFDALKREET